MRLTYRENYNQTTFDNAVYTLLRELEGESFTAYCDGKGIPSIGVGFNLRDEAVRSAVLDGLGFTLSDDETPYREMIANTVQATFEPNAAGTAILTTALNSVMSQRVNDPLLPADRSTFAFLESSEVRDVLTAITPIFDAKILSWERANQLTAPGVGSSIPLSPERLAIFSLAYNTPDGKKSLLGPALASAIRAGSRPNAWYEIRYNSNLGSERGVAKRRYIESEVFGLYSNASAVSADEAKDVYEMLAEHREAILKKESMWGSAPDGTRGTDRIVNLGETPLEAAKALESNLASLLDNQHVNTLNENLVPARDSFIEVAWVFRTGLKVE